MEKKNVRRRYFNAAIITLVAAVLIMGGVFGGIYAKDQVDMDVRTLTTSIRIAEALRANVILDEGFIVIKRPGRSGGKSIAIPTMRRASHKEKIVQVSFQSLFFRKTMDFEKTDALKMPPPAAE